MEWFEGVKIGAQQVVLWVETHPSMLLLALLLFAFVESFALLGVLVPGIAILALLGTLAASSGVNIWVALLLVYSGAVLGDGISYTLGYFLKEKVHAWQFFRKRPDWIPRASQHFRRFGIPMLAVARFIGPLRPVMPMSAGILGLMPKVFWPTNLVTATAWSTTIILPAYKLSNLLEGGNFYGASALVLVVLVFIGLMLWLFSRLQKMDDS